MENNVEIKPVDLPDFGQVSVLLATIMLVFTSSRFINLPPQSITFPLSNLYFSIIIDFNTIVSIGAASITASGAHWLIQRHARIDKKLIWQHIWLPGLTAWAVNTFLYSIPVSRLIWWVVLGLGGLALVFVLIAEFISVDSSNPRYPYAEIGLTTISMSLFLILITLWKMGSLRLFLLFPAIALGTLLISFRMFSLRYHNQTAFLEALTVTMISVHLTAALHYWPLTPIQTGLMVVGFVYALISLINIIQDSHYSRLAFIEPLAILLILWGSALWFS